MAHASALVAFLSNPKLPSGNPDIIPDAKTFNATSFDSSSSLE